MTRRSLLAPASAAVVATLSGAERRRSAARLELSSRGATDAQADRDAVEGWYRRFGAAARRRALALLGDEPAAADAVQEVFLRVLRERGSFRGEGSPLRWIYRITTNHCLNVLRDARRQQQLLEAKVRPVDAVDLPIAETRATLGWVLARLPGELSEVAVYFYIDEMSLDEIAELLSVSRRTVAYRLRDFRELAGIVVAER